MKYSLEYPETFLEEIITLFWEQVHYVCVPYTYAELTCVWVWQHTAFVYIYILELILWCLAHGCASDLCVKAIDHVRVRYCKSQSKQKPVALLIQQQFEKRTLYTYNGNITLEFNLKHTARLEKATMRCAFVHGHERSEKIILLIS
jgi:hypothetical protein